MSGASEDLARSWLKTAGANAPVDSEASSQSPCKRDKAESDFASARRLAEGDDPLLDTAAYHCQQTAEKARKSWLSAVEILFPKTHLLDELLDLCVQGDGAFESLRESCLMLTPLATEYRYPGDFFAPSDEEIERALRMAEEIVRFVSQRLSDRSVVL